MRWLTAVLVLPLAAGCGGAAGRGAAAGRTTSVPATHAPTTRAAASSAAPTTRTTTARPTALRYVFPVQGCAADPSSSHHDYAASDIFTGKGCAFVSPTSGRVDEVSRVDRWSPSTDTGATRGGLSVSVIGDDGVRYYGSHLQSIAAGIAPGARVRAGQLLGRIDNSGDAVSTPTHVHFGLSWPTRHGVWWVRRGEVWPQRYLSAWRAGRNLSPAAEVAAVHRRLGDEPACSVAC